MPVPTSGASAFSSGTAWRCMFEPISARLASSCSRNGIIAVATDQICSGETSIRSTSLGPTVTYWPACVRQRISVPFSLTRLGVHGRVRLGDQQLLFLGGVEVADLLGDDTVLDHAVGRRHEPVLGDLGERGQRADQADVRTLGGLDRAHAPVVGGVHVAHLDRRALAREATGAQRGQAAPVREPGERVGLVHELRQLGGAEELLQRRHHRADVDDRLRRDRVGVLGGEALAHDALHAVEPDPESLLDQLADGAQAAVAEVLVLVEVLGDGLARHAHGLGRVVLDLDLAVLGQAEALGQRDQLAHQREDVVVGERARVDVDVQAQTRVELVATRRA